MMPAGDKPLVVKIGGSLAGSGRLPVILALLAGADRRIAVVPGGGVFAEAVRSAQRDQGFSDAVAHRMALLAMHQMAELYCELEPRACQAETVEAFYQAWEANRLPVWLPLALAGADASLPEDWTLTSDALAAWLAARLGGDIVLVKSCDVDPAAAAANLARDGVVDQAFPRLVVDAGLAWRVLGRDDDGALRAIIGSAVDAPGSPC